MNFFKAIFTKQLLLTLLLLGVLTLLSFPLSRSWRQKRSIDQEIKGLQSQASKLEGKNSNLKNVLDYMQSDQFVEKEARTKLNYKKAGESVVVIEDRPGTSVTASPSLFEVPPAPPTYPEPKTVINFNKWLDYFFKVQK